MCLDRARNPSGYGGGLLRSLPSATLPFVRYLTSDGTYGEYKSSFGAADLEALAYFFGGGWVMPLGEVQKFALNNPAARVVGVRHDVDHSLEHALTFARWEYDRGYRSSYYVLPSAPYFEEDRRSGRLVRQLLDLQSMGHEVGIHNDAYSMIFRQSGMMSCAEALRLLRGQIDLLREWGITVTGAADHGGQCDNSSIWAAGAIPADVGLEYEAYQLHRGLNANYISDNRGQWRSPLEHVPGKVAIVLCHPCHWDPDCLTL